MEKTMNMIMTPDDICRHRQLVQEQRQQYIRDITKGVCDLINETLIAGFDSDPILTFKTDGYRLSSLHWGLKECDQKDALTVAEAAKATVIEECAKAGYYAEIAFDPARNMVYGTLCKDPCILYGLDIVSFAESILKCNLHASQKAVLKALYAGSPYNAEFDLTEADLRAIFSSPIPGLYGVDLPTIHRLMQIAQSPSVTATLRIGRRGGRTLLSSICATYEIYRVWQTDSEPSDHRAIMYCHSGDSRLIEQHLDRLATCFPSLVCVYSTQDGKTYQRRTYATKSGRALIQFYSGYLPATIRRGNEAAMISDLSNLEYPEQGSCPAENLAVNLHFSAIQDCDLVFPAWVMNSTLDAAWLHREREKNFEEFDRVYGAR